MQPRASRASSATPFHATTRTPTRASRSAPCPTAYASTPSAPRTNTASCAASLTALGSYGIAPDQCTSCEKGKYSDRAGTRASVCTLCPAGKYNPVEGAAGPGSCLPCEKGKYATMGAPQCLQVCRRGQEQLSNTECKDCPAGMTSDESPEPKCVRCDVGKFATTPGSRSCESALRGQPPP